MKFVKKADLALQGRLGMARTSQTSASLCYLDNSLSQESPRHLNEKKPQNKWQDSTFL